MTTTKDNRKNAPREFPANHYLIPDNQEPFPMTAPTSLIDRAGLFILENLDLRNAAAGVYDLIALPLRIKGGDGSPIRAVLQTRD